MVWSTNTVPSAKKWEKAESYGEDVWRTLPSWNPFPLDSVTLLASTQNVVLCFSDRAASNSSS